MYYPDEKEYMSRRKFYKSVPVSLEFPSDTETPITIYARIAGKRPSFLLESVEGGERLGRYSFVGTDPLLTFTCSGSSIVVETGKGRFRRAGNPFRVIEGLLEDFRSPAMEGLPRFYGGLVGYLGYDLVRHIERLPDSGREKPGVPDSILMVPGVTVVIDHLRHTLRIIVNTVPADDGMREYGRAVSTINEIASAIRKGGRPPLPAVPANCGAGTATPNLTRDQYIKRVEKAKEYIRAGEILQVVLSRRIDTDFRGDPFSVYRRLRRKNPSPYLYFLNLGSLALAGSSPEMLLRVEDGQVETRPIAGTRPRGSGPREDQLLAAELLSDEKERAEHVMLVDLGRNDVGKVSRPGTVKVPQFMEVEKYSHVMHLVSSVTGELSGRCTAMDALKACFPAGTVSGAPKVRAMEIIEELEPARRGPYAGAVGYLGFNGGVDTAIAIRTIVFHGGKASVQAGAGIVHDSDPAREFSETENKAGALIESLTGEDGHSAFDY